MASVPSGTILVREMSPTILAPGRCPPIPGFAPLTHFDLDGGTGIQIPLMYAEPSGGDLHDGVLAVGVKILVEPALAGIVADAKLLRRSGKGRRGRCS